MQQNDRTLAGGQARACESSADESGTTDSHEVSALFMWQIWTVLQKHGPNHLELLVNIRRRPARRLASPSRSARAAGGGAPGRAARRTPRRMQPLARALSFCCTPLCL